MSVPEIMALRQNAIRILAQESESHRHVDARVVMNAINKEFERRQLQAIQTDEYFRWPSTEAAFGHGAIDTHDWLQEGVLKFMGYSASTEHGRSSVFRQQLLNEIFTGTIPPVFPTQYIEEWGKPSSARRLQKMAESIAAFARNAKRRRSQDLSSAIRVWEQDLKYLYFQFYVGKFLFAWPETYINY